MQEQARIVFFADTHLGFDFPIRPKLDIRRRGQDFFDNFRRVLEYAASTRPDLIVHGGDLFFRSRVSPAIVDIVYDELLRFAKHGIPIFIAPGNHERSRLPDSLWLSESNIYMFDVPRTFQIISSNGTKFALSGFPFVRNDIRQSFKSILRETGWQHTSDGIKLLCMHQAIEGAQVGPSNYTFLSGDDVVRMSDIPSSFVAVLSGHIHRRQVLRRANRTDAPPLIYAGSTERTSFAERDEPKGFYDVTLARNRDGAWRVCATDFIELPTRPMVVLDIDGKVEHSNLDSYFRRKLETLDQNAIVRLRAAGRIDETMRARLKASFLRSVFPWSMTVDLGGIFHRDTAEALENE
jgi:DNA repair exonuclease SbcCD nuclease subunit